MHFHLVIGEVLLKNDTYYLAPYGKFQEDDFNENSKCTQHCKASLVPKLLLLSLYIVHTNFKIIVRTLKVKNILCCNFVTTIHTYKEYICSLKYVQAQMLHYVLFCTQYSFITHISLPFNDKHKRILIQFSIIHSTFLYYQKHVIRQQHKT